MEYYCPNCGTEMEAVFCDCKEVAGVHLYKYPDGRWYHTKYGKPLSPTELDQWKLRNG